MAIISILLTVIIVAVSILMVLIVLVQRPKQEGLGAAFGGSTLDSALGAHTTDVLQKITTWLGIIFFVSAIGLAMVKTRQFSSSAASDVLEKVENREPELPAGFPPPGIGAPPVTTPAEGEAPAAPAKADGKAKEAPAKADGKAKEAPKADKAGKAKADPAKAEGGKAKADSGKAKGGNEKSAPKAPAGGNAPKGGAKKEN